MMAAVTLRFLNPFGTGKVVLFQVTYDKVCHAVFDWSLTHYIRQDWHAYELVFFILLGVLGVRISVVSEDFSLN
jgi:chloride channel 3/4/5